MTSEVVYDKILLGKKIMPKQYGNRMRLGKRRKITVARTKSPYVTMEDVARAAGTTRGTVSKAIRGSVELNRETALRIRAIAREMGYDTDHLNCKYARTGTVGVVFTEMNSEYYNSIVESFRRALGERGYRMVTMIADYNDADAQVSCIEYLARLHVLGILVLSEINLDLKRIRALLDEEMIPAVFISNMRNINFGDVVTVNHALGVELAMNRLFELGHKKIAFIGDVYTSVREKAYRASMKEAGLAVSPDHTVICRERFCRGGFEAAERLLSLPEDERPTAIMAAYDSLAYGAMKYAHNAGIAVPDDLSVISIDDNLVSSYYNPSLSSIRVPVEEIGTRTASLIRARIEGNPGKFSTVLFTPELIERESTGPVKE